MSTFLTLKFERIANGILVHVMPMPTRDDPMAQRTGSGAYFAPNTASAIAQAHELLDGALADLENDASERSMELPPYVRNKTRSSLQDEADALERGMRETHANKPERIMAGEDTVVAHGQPNELGPPVIEAPQVGQPPAMKIGEAQTVDESDDRYRHLPGAVGLSEGSEDTGPR